MVGLMDKVHVREEAETCLRVGKVYSQGRDQLEVLGGPNTCSFKQFT